MSDIFVATETAQVTVDGQEIALVAGQTTVRAGHPVLTAYPAWFGPFTPNYDWQPSTEPRNQVRADAVKVRAR